MIMGQGQAYGITPMLPVWNYTHVTCVGHGQAWHVCTVVHHTKNYQGSLLTCHAKLEQTSITRRTTGAA